MINFKNIIFGLAILILTIFVGVYGISTIYGESPRYDSFCPYNLFDKATCEAEGGIWMTSTDFVDARIEKPAQAGYCQYDYTDCQKEYENAEREHYRKIFLTALPIAIIIILIGAFALNLESVSMGLMLGGIGLIIYGTGAYWRFTDDLMKFLLSLVGLAVLIYAAYWFNKKEKKFWQRFFLRKK